MMSLVSKMLALRHKSKYPTYNKLENRVLSLKKKLPLMFQQLAECGFFYCTQYETVICYLCGASYGFSFCDPNIMHYGYCRYLNLTTKVIDPMVILSKRKEEIVQKEEENKDLSDNLRCKICMYQRMQVILQPCKHLVSCLDCSKKLSDCPICRVPVKDIMVVYIA